MQPEIFDLGLVEFKQAYEFQQKLLAGVLAGSAAQSVIFCEHYPVITLGRRAKLENIRLSDLELIARGISVCKTDRGGDVTYHGPGQLVVYPIVCLSNFRRDIHFFLRYLEDFIIRVLGEFGIKGYARSGSAGVWVENKKIASLGIAIKHWISYHGLAINVKESSLENFSTIRPCGMDIAMTSMESIINRSIETDEVKEIIRRVF